MVTTIKWAGYGSWLSQPEGVREFLEAYLENWLVLSALMGYTWKIAEWYVQKCGACKLVKANFAALTPKQTGPRLTYLHGSYEWRAWWAIQGNYEIRDDSFAEGNYMEYDARSQVPKGANTLPLTWAYKLKRYPDGRPRKFKVRLCVRGDKLGRRYLLHRQVCSSSQLIYREIVNDIDCQREVVHQIGWLYQCLCTKLTLRKLSTVNCPSAMSPLMDQMLCSSSTSLCMDWSKHP